MGQSPKGAESWYYITREKRSSFLSKSGSLVKNYRFHCKWIFEQTSVLVLNTDLWDEYELEDADSLILHMLSYVILLHLILTDGHQLILVHIMHLLVTVQYSERMSLSVWTQVNELYIRYIHILHHLNKWITYILDKVSLSHVLLEIPTPPNSRLSQACHGQNHWNSVCTMACLIHSMSCFVLDCQFLLWGLVNAHILTATYDQKHIY